jgi:hypothetical protein
LQPSLRGGELAEPVQVAGHVRVEPQGERVVAAEGVACGGHGVLVEVEGLAVAAEQPEADREVVDRPQRIRVAGV